MKVKENLPAERQKLDFLGAAFLLLMMFPLIYYLNVATDIGWTSHEGLGLLMLTFIGAGLLVWWEQRAKDPLLSLRLVRDGNINRANMVGMILFMAMAGSYLLLPYYLQFVQGYETMQYGLILIANSIGMMVAGPMVGRIADRTGNNKVFVVAGALTSALGFFLMTLFDNDTQLWYILLSLFVMGAGMGMALVGSTNLAFGYIREGENGQLSGLTNTYRQAGSSAGVAILNAIFMSSIVLVPTIDLIPGFRHAFFAAVLIAMVGFVFAMSLKDKPKATESSQ